MGFFVGFFVVVLIKTVVVSAVGVVLSGELEVENVSSDVDSTSVDVVDAEVVVVFLFGRL